MGRISLVEADIQGGKRLIQALISADFPLDQAYWYYFPESEEWRLVLASPMVSKRGPLAAYRLVESVLGAIKPRTSLSLSDVSLLSPVNSLIEVPQWAARPRSTSAPQVLDAPAASGVMTGGTYIYNIPNLAQAHRADGRQGSSHRS